MAVEAPPAEFAAYSPTRHVIQHAKGLSKGPNRHVSGDLIRECIEDGVPKKVNRHKWRFQKRIGGVDFVTVVATDAHEILTAHPIAVDRPKAERRGYWSATELDDLEAVIEYHEQKQPRPF
ncbi:hypothetical protein C440_05612 [Haloferax mucosum ATCC BAA-1512]|uniref:Uncharacterized protein n=1 Tax=Haloferax mucosum ATCC BAA-1512 TaxID=662479 RepID=M0IJ49_9EURY|nr:hypothetical protein [Haloferax mucosum]ELZ96042.1 hypothetical protein C440_05612 [Haloferax mucosum ATCC BAA-1512]